MKAIATILTIIFCAGCVLATEFKSHSRHKTRTHRETKANKPGGPSTITMKQEDIDKMTEENKKAEEIFAANKLGRDNPDEVFFQHDISFKDIPDITSFSNAKTGDKMPEPKTLIISRNALGVTSPTDVHYRGIEYGMDLLELFGSGDSETSGRCCSGLGEIQQYWFKVSEAAAPVQLQCLNVQGKFDTWQICHKAPTIIAKIRASILVSVIKAVLRSKGFYNVNVFLPDPNDLGDWSWNNQDSWTGLCKTGKRQSPIDLDRGRAEIVDYLSVRFAFTRAIDATAKWNGHEMEVVGDFGKFYLRKEIGDLSYMTAKIVFKFPSEHTIMNNYGGEMQVYATSQNGDAAVLSFFLEQVEGNVPAQTNKFIQNLKIERWRNDVEDPISLVDESSKEAPADISTDKVPSLDYLIFQERQESDKDFSKQGRDGKIQGNNPKNWELPDIFRKTFFMYSGSSSTPPCKEGVQWFVFEQPIYMPNSQFLALKRKAFNNDLDSNGNSRTTKPQGKNRVFWHMDNGVKCANYSATQLDSSDMSSWERSKTKENLQVDLRGIKKTWLRASNIMTTYGYTGADTPDFVAAGLDKLDPGARQSIALEEIDPNTTKDEMFGIAKTKLLTEAEKHMKEVCKKESKETYKEMREKYDSSESAIKVPWFDRRRRRRRRRR